MALSRCRLRPCRSRALIPSLRAPRPLLSAVRPAPLLFSLGTARLSSKANSGSSQTIHANTESSPQAQAAPVSAAPESITASHEADASAAVAVAANSPSDLAPAPDAPAPDAPAPDAPAPDAAAPAVSPLESAQMVASSAKQSAASLARLLPRVDAARARDRTVAALHAVNRVWARHGSLLTVGVGAAIITWLSSNFLTAATVASFKAGAVVGGLGLAGSYVAYSRYLAIEPDQAVEAVLARLRTDSRVVSKIGVDISANAYRAISETAPTWSLRAPELESEPVAASGAAPPLGAKLRLFVTRRFQRGRLKLVFGVGTPQAAQPTAVASAEVVKDNGRLVLSALVLDFPDGQERWVLEGDALTAADLFRPGVSIFAR